MERLVIGTVALKTEVARGNTTEKAFASRTGATISATRTEENFMMIDESIRRRQERRCATDYLPTLENGILVSLFSDEQAERQRKVLWGPSGTGREEKMPINGDGYSGFIYGILRASMR